MTYPFSNLDFNIAVISCEPKDLYLPLWKERLNSDGQQFRQYQPNAMAYVKLATLDCTINKNSQNDHA
jgi:hypothetical protein